MPPCAPGYYDICKCIALCEVWVASSSATIGDLPSVTFKQTIGIGTMHSVDDISNEHGSKCAGATLFLKPPFLSDIHTIKCLRKT